MTVAKEVVLDSLSVFICCLLTRLLTLLFLVKAAVIDVFVVHISLHSSMVFKTESSSCMTFKSMPSTRNEY